MMGQITREQFEDIKNFHTGIDVIARMELELVNELVKNKYSFDNYYLNDFNYKKWNDYWFKPKGKQIFSENDPYGEENWEDEL